MFKDKGGHGQNTIIGNEKIEALVEASPRTTDEELSEELDVANEMISNQLFRIRNLKIL